LSLHEPTNYWWWQHITSQSGLIKPLKTSKKQEVARFVYERIVTHFGIPFHMISNNGLQFIIEVIEKLMKKLSIKHKITTIYKPNTNGLVEHTNKVLYNILNKEIDVRKNLHNWDKQVHHAMWVYNSTFKSSTGFIYFHLVYGGESTSPIEYELMTFCITTQDWLKVEESQKKRLLELVELEESQL
jgi:hypothetical protein